ncbi:MAG: hypothetical protein IJF34_11700 [Clostridia bacterium]|nr:hypothetical protein [Clostridia bacterium]MBQ4624036.1 hypothetical protein [Clostridia bacterium]
MAEGKKKGNEKEEIDARKKGSIAETKEEKRKEGERETEGKQKSISRLLYYG